MIFCKFLVNDIFSQRIGEKNLEKNFLEFGKFLGKIIQQSIKNDSNQLHSNSIKISMIFMN